MNKGFIAELINEGLASLKVSPKLDNTASWIEAGANHIDQVKCGPCHSGLGNGSRHYVLNYNQTKYKESHGAGKWTDTTDNEKKAYLHWLMNDSPYSSAFIEKDATTVLEWGFTLITGDVAGNLVGAAAVAQRRLWEYTNIAVVWNDLVAGGMEPNMAYCMSHLINGKANREGKYNWLNAGTGHTTIDTHGFSKHALHNFVAGKPSDLTSKFNSTGNYRGYSEMFGHGAYSITKFGEMVKGKEAAPSSNPFKVDRGVDKSFSYEDAIEGMLALIPTIKKECDLI